VSSQPPIIVTTPANGATITCSGSLSISGTSQYPTAHYVVYLRDANSGVTLATWDSNTDANGNFSGTQTPNWSLGGPSLVFAPFIDPGSGPVQGQQTYVTCAAAPALFTPYRYLSDDGNHYTVRWLTANEATSAGNLPAAISTDPVYPSLWTPRVMVAHASISGSDDRQLCICNPDNGAFVSGPRSTITISGVTYTVTSCIGERRDSGA
jgi:hypothetical protein